MPHLSCYCNGWKLCGTYFANFANFECFPKLSQYKPSSHFDLKKNLFRNCQVKFILNHSLTWGKNEYIFFIAFNLTKSLPAHLNCGTLFYTQKLPRFLLGPKSWCGSRPQYPTSQENLNMNNISMILEGDHYYQIKGK